MSASPGFELPMAATVAPEAPAGPVRDAAWERAARMAVLLSWASLFYMAVEGMIPREDLFNPTNLERLCGASHVPAR